MSKNIAQNQTTARHIPDKHRVPNAVNDTLPIHEVFSSFLLLPSIKTQKNVDLSPKLCLKENVAI